MGLIHLLHMNLKSPLTDEELQQARLLDKYSSDADDLFREVIPITQLSERVDGQRKSSQHT
jgi:hypothetical protein